MGIHHGLNDTDIKRGTQAMVDFFAQQGFTLSLAQQRIADKAFETAAQRVVDKNDNRLLPPFLF